MTRKIAKDDTPKKVDPRPVTDLLKKKLPHPHPQVLAENLAWTTITQTRMTLMIVIVIVDEEDLVVALAVSVFFQARPAFPNGGHAPSNLLLYSFHKKYGVRVTSIQLIGFASRQPPQVVLR